MNYSNLPRDLLSIQGPDTVTFLQGQVSCNMQELAQENSLRGVLCNLQGRVIADFRVLPFADGCLMAVSAGLGEKVRAVLAKYAVFSKVEINLLNQDWQVVGFIDEEESKTSRAKLLPAADDEIHSIQDQAFLIRIDGSSSKQPGAARYELWRKSDSPLPQFLSAQTLDSQAAQEQTESAAWQELNCMRGVAHINADISEQFTPQALNYDLAGLVSFNKGCYTGQEVVARMHFRGKAKKRLQLVHIQAPIQAQLALAQLNSGGIIDAESTKRVDEGILALCQQNLVIKSAAGESVSGNSASNYLALAVLPVLDTPEKRDSAHAWRLGTASLEPPPSPALDPDSNAGIAAARLHLLPLHYAEAMAEQQAD